MDACHPAYGPIRLYAWMNQPIGDPGPRYRAMMVVNGIATFVDGATKDAAIAAAMAFDHRAKPKPKKAAA